MASTQEIQVRRERGQTIANVEANVRRLDEHEYRVVSQSGSGEYAILSTEKGWTCSCPDFIFREQKCKHIFAVELSLEIRRRIENSKRIIPLDFQSCLSSGFLSLRLGGSRRAKDGQASFAGRFTRAERATIDSRL